MIHTGSVKSCLAAIPALVVPLAAAGARSMPVNRDVVGAGIECAVRPD